MSSTPHGDQLLTACDRWLFLGHNPLVLLHDVLGQRAAAYVLVVVFESFSTIVWVAFVAVVASPDRST